MTDNKLINLVNISKSYGDTVVFGTGIVDEQGTRMCIALLQKK